MRRYISAKERRYYTHMLEIVAVDSSSGFIVAKDAQLAEKFKGLFPKAKTDY